MLELKNNRIMSKNEKITDIAISGKVEELKGLIINGAKPPNGILQKVIFSGWSQGESIEILEILVGAGADINDFTDNQTPLHAAANVGPFPKRSFAVTDFLLKKGANPNLKNNQGETPIFTAVETIADKTVKRLITEGADINSKNNEGDPLLHSCILAYYDFLGEDCDDEDNIEYATMYMLNNLKHILEAKPDLALTNNENLSVLQTCLAIGDKPFTKTVIKLLIEAGALTNVKTPIGDDNLSLLALGVLLDHSVEVLDILIEFNDILKVETQGIPNLFFLMYLNPKKTKALLELRPNLIQSEFKGNTLIHFAILAKELKVKVIKFLIEKGVDPNKKTDKGTTAMSLAIENGNKKLIKLLQKHEK